MQSLVQEKLYIRMEFFFKDITVLAAGAGAVSHVVCVLVQVQVLYLMLCLC